MKIKGEVREYIDGQIKGERLISYDKLIKAVVKNYGVKLSKSALSKRAKALRLRFRRGRKRILPVNKKPGKGIFLDCAGAFFLKGTELEMGLLKAVNQQLKVGSKSARARRALKLAQQINSILLYAPIFGLRTAQEIASYNGRGLSCLSEEKDMPEKKLIEQYLQFLTEKKLLSPTIKEVTQISAEALYLGIDFAGQKFYLDAQLRTAWPAPNIPTYFSSSIYKARSYVKDIFQSPSAQHPLILQTCPGYTFLPPEMCSLMQCFEQTQKKPISRIIIVSKAGETVGLWQDVKPAGKCYFLAPLSPWQYAKLQGIKVIRDYQRYHIGPAKEPMEVADAQIDLFDSQLNKNIRVRAALIKRKEERLALVTNISRPEERYIRKIAEHYFSRWPDEKIKTYYDLMEMAEGEVLTRSKSKNSLTHLLITSYGQKPEDAFTLFLEHLHRVALARFFPAEYEAESLNSMAKKFYQHSGYLKIKSNCWEITLEPFSQKKLQKDAQIACQRFNQSNLKLSSQKSLHIFLQQSR